MNTEDWGQAIVIDPRALRTLEIDNQRLRIERDHTATRLRRTRLVLLALGVAALAAAVQATRLSHRLNATEQTSSRESREARIAVRRARADAERASAALGALSRSHDGILSATQQAPSVGTKSWGRRFTVTKYLARDPAYGKFNDGFTSTMKAANPSDRIVAVDPKLIPYHSWVWIEDLGWYRAEDCGSAIKGFRLDVMSGSSQDAFAFGRQDRFVIVVPDSNA